MPGKSTHTEHLTRSRAPVFPADADDIDRYRRNAVAPRHLDGDGRDGSSGLHPWGPRPARGNERVRVQRAPAAALLQVELLRIEKILDGHAADARQRDDLPRGR